MDKTKEINAEVIKEINYPPEPRTILQIWVWHALDREWDWEFDATNEENLKDEIKDLLEDAGLSFTNIRVVRIELE